MPDLPRDKTAPTVEEQPRALIVGLCEREAMWKRVGEEGKKAIEGRRSSRPFDDIEGEVVQLLKVESNGRKELPACLCE